MARQPDSRPRKAHDAWLPVEYGKREAAAVQAFFRGEATAEQQLFFRDFLVNEVCATYDLSFRPDNQRVTDFCEGKRFVGTQIVKLSKIPLSRIVEPGEPPEPSEQG